MLSLQYIRDHPDEVRRALELRHAEAQLDLDRILELDQRHRALLHEAESLRARRNEVSREIGRVQALRQEQDAASFERLRVEMRQVGDRIKELEEQQSPLEEELNALLLQLPNLPAADVPEGPDESGNVVVHTEGEPRPFDFTPKPHWELGERLGIIDFERGVKLAGSRFYVLIGLGARLQRALITWMLDVHTSKHGYTEVYPPAMVKESNMWSGGWLPKFADNMYHDAEEDLWFIPTAEVALTNMHRDEVLPPGALPIRYVAYTPCFRREKMSAGKDVRGLKRGHQFDKVEMYKFVEPERSSEEFERMRADAEEMCRLLGIPHRVLQLCTGDLGFNAAKTYDIEMWAPGCDEWLEVSSVSNCTDFQARRANIRFRREPGARPDFVHTLNGSGLALPRVMIAVLETYQQADGTILIPEVLRPYMGGMEIIR